MNVLSNKESRTEHHSVVNGELHIFKEHLLDGAFRLSLAPKLAFVHLT